MPKNFTCRLPWPPSVNHYWRGRGNHRYLSARAKSYREQAFGAVWQDHAFLPRFDPPVSLQIIAYPPDRRRRDLDNLLKATLDVLQLCQLIRDDYDIAELTIERGTLKAKGLLCVTLTALPPLSGSV